MKKLLSALMAVLLALSLPLALGNQVNAETTSKNEAVLKNDSADLIPASLGCKAKSVALIEARTGTLLYAENENTPYPPASVTKIMTLLLTMEAIDQGKISLSDRVTVSGHAASMGGSQVYLEEGEEMTVGEMVKCCVIASANDCAVALAEVVAGSEERFVAMMNEKADRLGMKNSHFENVTGLDDTVENHVCSALDIALMSKELIAYPVITEYASVWQDTIREGAFTLTNTNRLVRYYDGCNGLKTGSTAKAGYCVSAAAKRNGMQLIAVVMGADSRDARNETAKALLDYGFSTSAVFDVPEKSVGQVAVKRGTKQTAECKNEKFCVLIPKGREKDVQIEVILSESLSAGFEAGAQAGKIVYRLDGEVIGECRVVTAESVPKITFSGLFLRFLLSLLGENRE